LSGEVTVPPAAVTRARNRPAAGVSPLASTEILERLERRSQRSRMDATAAAAGVVPSPCACDSTEAGEEGPDGVSEQAPRTAAAAASATPGNVSRESFMVCLRAEEEMTCEREGPEGKR
jgi:hypothetical protein